MGGQQVFLCYAREDWDFVEKQAQRLKSQGLDVWVDQWDIHPSEDWDIAIEEALDGSPVVMVYLSPDSVSSMEVRSELRFALNARKTVLPVLVRESRIPRQLLLTQHIDFTQRPPDDSEGVEEILRVLDSRADEPGPGQRSTDVTEETPPAQDAVPGAPPVAEDASPPSSTPQVYDGVLHWMDYMGNKLAVGELTVHPDRIAFESKDRSFEIPFDEIQDMNEIPDGRLGALTIRTTSGLQIFDQAPMAKQSSFRDPDRSAARLRMRVALWQREHMGESAHLTIKWAPRQS